MIAKVGRPFLINHVQLLLLDYPIAFFTFLITLNIWCIYKKRPKVRAKGQGIVERERGGQEEKEEEIFHKEKNFLFISFLRLVVQMATFGGTQQKCMACEKTVYLVDKLTADNRIYHRACFRCHHCKGTLKVINTFLFLSHGLIIFH